MRYALAGLATVLVGLLLQTFRNVGGTWNNDLADTGEIVTFVGWALVAGGLIVMAINA